jgi:hypothetical protein
MKELIATILAFINNAVCATNDAEQWEELFAALTVLETATTIWNRRANAYGAAATAWSHCIKAHSCLERAVRLADTENRTAWGVKFKDTTEAQTAMRRYMIKDAINDALAEINKIPTC